jgi:hypothetical protein
MSNKLNNKSSKEIVKPHQLTLGFNPLVSNRGGLPDLETDVGVDWLSYTVSGDLRTECWEIITRFYPLELSAKNPVPSMGYRRVDEFQDGPKVSYSDDRPEIHIQFSGQVISMLSLGRQFSLVREFLHLGAKCTRIDLRLDDFRQLVTPAQMVEWAKQGFLCRFKRWEPKESFSGTQSLGLTFTAGKRGKLGSGCYFRCYEWHFNKFEKKVNGRNPETSQTDCIRFESAYSQHKSQAVCSRLAEESGLENVHRVICEIILGSIDFRSGTTDQGYRDRPRLPIWESYTQGIPPYKFVAPKRVVSTDFSNAAFSRQWGCKLAGLLQSQGFSSFSNTISLAVADGVRRGYGVAVSAEKMISLKKILSIIYPNLEHSRRQYALLPSLVPEQAA